MRADLPATVAAAVERQLASGRPALIFDKARLAANMREMAAAAHAQDVKVLFAAKSFSHPVVWNLAAEHLDGFDVASVGELATVPDARIVSIADPTGRAGSTVVERPRGTSHDEMLVEHNALLRISTPSKTRTIVACETVAQIAAAPAHAEIAIRISASITGTDPAVGAILDGTGHRRSRFGVDLSSTELEAMGRAVGNRHIGLHVHHGPVTATSGERFVETARAAIEFAAKAGIVPAFIDLGGAWHGVRDLPATFAHVRSSIDMLTGQPIEILVEPGRAITNEAGFACGRVVVARELAERSVRVVDLSRLCHLRWSPVELVGSAPHAGTGVNTVVLGPTCSEEDLVGEWTVPPGMLDEGNPVVLRGVTGYSVAWNTAFGGVPPIVTVFA